MRLKRLLLPLSLTRSLFVPFARPAATGYRADGSAVEGKFHVYPEMAAAGLRTTPTDLVKFRRR